MTNEVGFRRKYTTIKGISTIRRLTWKGKIRLGIKVKYGKDKEGNDLYRPKETEFFVCPSEVKAFYGEKPKKLSIMFPLNDMESIFPQAYKFYGKSKGLKCSGDGVDATFVNDEGEMENRKCPCENLKPYDPKTKTGGCSKRGTLLFFIPAVSLGAVYAMDFGSFHSIVDVQSGIALAQEMLKGRIAMVPFTLSRVQKETHNEDKKQIHWTLQCELAIKDPKEIKRIREGENIFRGQNKIYEIEEREEDKNPAYDSKKDSAVIEEETEEEIEERLMESTRKAEALIKEYDELEARKVELKKQMEEGKHDIKTYQEAKIIAKKEKEEGENVVEVPKEDKPKTETNNLATDLQKKTIYGDVVCEACGTKVYGFRCLKCKNTDLHVIEEGLYHDPLLTRADFEKEMKPTLYPLKLTTVLADNIIFWWKGNKKVMTIGERVKRESKEEAETIEPIIEGTKEERIKAAQEIVSRPGKLEIKDKDAPFPGEKEEKPGSSFNNAIPFESKKKKISKGEDFIAPK